MGNQAAETANRRNARKEVNRGIRPRREQLKSGNGEMHEVFLGSLYFSAPFEAQQLHLAYYRSFGSKAPSTFARSPGTALNESASGPPFMTVLVKSVLHAVDVNSRAEGMVAEFHSFAICVQCTLGSDRTITAY